MASSPLDSYEVAHHHLFEQLVIVNVDEHTHRIDERAEALVASARGPAPHSFTPHG